MSQWLVIGLSGVTCGGKTTISTMLRDFFAKNAMTRIPNTYYEIGDVKLVNQDNYFLPVEDKRHEWIWQLKHINWEILSAIDMKKMLNDISCIIKDDFLVQKNRTIPMAVMRLNILIIEGFLIFNQPELLEISQMKFHLHIPYEKCFARRKARTYDPPDVVGYFEMSVWPMYEKHLAEFKDRKDVTTLNGDLCPERLMKYILKCVHLFLEFKNKKCEYSLSPLTNHIY